MITYKLSSNRNGISHKEANNSSIQADNDRNIDIEEGNSKAKDSNRHIIDIESYLLLFFISDVVQQIFSCEETEDRHD